MIRTKRQLVTTKRRVAELKSALKCSEELKGTIDPHAYTIMRAQHEQKISELNAAIDAFNLLSEKDSFRVQTLEDVPRVLEVVRNSRGITQKQISDSLKGTAVQRTPQAIQQYEANNYATAPFSVIIAVAKILDIRLVGEFLLTEEIRQPRIIVVEDDSGNRNLLVQNLQRREPDWKIYAASGIAEFEGIISKITPDIVVTDLKMQGNDEAGLTVAEISRLNAPHAAVIVLSSYIDRIDKHRAISSGVMSMVEKSDPGAPACASIHTLASTILSLKTG